MGAWYQSSYQLSQFIAKTLFGFRVVHRERIIEDGPAILAMNHQSYLDPPLAGIACRREIHYLARKTLMDWPILGRLFPKLNVIPVDQIRADMSALKSVIKLIRAGHCTVIFPEGARTLDGQLQPAQPGLGLVIAKTLAPVVPMRIFGAYEAFPRGGKPRPFRPITLVVGEPIRFHADDLAGESGRALYQRLSERVMKRIAAIEYERR
ncbi:MAG TPA: lysophospholipid acyltransferase family protein [Chthoniobacteraceae bacterium]|jgi:1-acyl-sn-glycerol-3-phosphate acyltransferase|nr:lysophospholipid acyltransferase family protein [Chthoniobacteraceae bacterium]